MSGSDRPPRWTLAACVALGLVLRVAWLGAADLWSDEVQTLRAVALPLGEMTSDRLRAGHVPLYFLLLRTWTGVIGDSQFALRLPSALLGAAAIVPAWSLVRRLADERAALWAAALVAVHPLLVELSREARMYSLLALVLLVLADAAVRVATHPDDVRVPRRLWIAAIVGPFVHPSWAFGVLPLAVWVASRRRHAEAPRRAALSRVLAGLVASVALLALAVAAGDAQRQELTRRPWPQEVLVFVLRPYLGSHPANWFPTAGLAVVAWAVALAAGSRAARESGPGGLAPGSLASSGLTPALGESSGQAAGAGAPAGRGSALRAFSVVFIVGVPLASACAGLVAGVPWGPARYTQCVLLGAIPLAAAASPLAAGVAAGPAAPSLQTALRTVGALARGFLAASLLLLTLMVVGRPGTAWSDGGARVRRDVPPGETVWVDDESARLLLTHYAGRTVRLGRPDDGAEHWRARRADDAVRPRVEVVRER